MLNILTTGGADTNFTGVIPASGINGFTVYDEVEVALDHVTSSGMK